MAYLFWPPSIKSIPVNNEKHHYPVHRIFCVGRNHVELAKEMGIPVDREKPFYFLKSVAHFENTGKTIPYPSGMTSFHYEIELVVAMGKRFSTETCQRRAGPFMAMQ